MAGRLLSAIGLLFVVGCPCPAAAQDSTNETEGRLELNFRLGTGTSLQAYHIVTLDEGSLSKDQYGLAIAWRAGSHWSYDIGARYIDTIQDGASSSKEDRGIVDAQFKQGFAGKWTFSNRNRLDLRWVEGQPFSYRIRDRIALDRKSSIGGYEFSPYASYELFYDSRYDRIANKRARIGLTVPLGRVLTLDSFYGRTREVYPDSSTTNTFGITLVFMLD